MEERPIGDDSDYDEWSDNRLQDELKPIEVKISVNGVEWTHKGDYDTLYNNDWDHIIREEIDKQKYEGVRFQ